MPVEETRFMPFGQVVSNEAGRFARIMTVIENGSLVLLNTEEPENNGNN